MNEKHLMSGLVANPELAVASGLTRQDFGTPQCAQAFEMLLARLAQGEPVSPLTVGMPDLPPPPSNAETATLARDLWGQAVAKRVAHEAESLLRSGRVGDDFLEALAAAVDRVGRGGGSTPRVRDIAQQRASELLMRQGGGRVKTGYPDLDAKLGGGFLRGVPVVLGARPGHGKSAMALGITRNVVRSGGNALVFSLEDAARQYTDRVLALESGLPANSLERGGVDLTSEASRLPAGWWLDDGAGLTSRSIARRSRLAAHRAGHLDLVVVDYIQLVRTEKEKSPPEAIKDAMADLAKLARDLDCPVLVLSQINRGPEASGSREKRAPSMADLKWSGSLEEVAKMVLIVDRPYIEDQNQDHWIDVHVGKNSFGPAGVHLRMAWNGPLTKVG